jgi:transcriptional regulator with XRE-family HTH domain
VARRVKEPVATVKASAMAKFANQLRGWRLKLGWSQAELAAKLGYSNALVSQVEQQQKPASAEFAEKCDQAFDTPATFADRKSLSRVRLGLATSRRSSMRRPARPRFTSGNSAWCQDSCKPRSTRDP